MSDSSLFFSDELEGRLQEFLEEKFLKSDSAIIFSAYSQLFNRTFELQVQSVTFSAKPIVELKLDIPTAFDIARNARDLELENLKIIYYGKETRINGNFSVVTATVGSFEPTEQQCILQLLLENKSETII